MSEEAEKKTADGVSVERAYAAVMQSILDERDYLLPHYTECVKSGLGLIRKLDESKIAMLEKFIKASKCGEIDADAHEKAEKARNDELDEMLNVVEDGLSAAKVLIESYEHGAPITNDRLSGMRILQVSKAAAKVREFRASRECVKDTKKFAW